MAGRIDPFTRLGKVAAVSLWVSLCAMPVQAATLAGRAYAIDGDTLVIKGRHIRLFGVDAFEHDQTCGRFACGVKATEAMTALIHGRIVSCDQKDIDSYGRMVAICKLPDGRDLGGEMVRAGLAVAYRTYSQRYLPQEKAAQSARVGAWAYGFESPVHYRRRTK